MVLGQMLCPFTGTNNIAAFMSGLPQKAFVALRLTYNPAVLAQSTNSAIKAG